MQPAGLPTHRGRAAPDRRSCCRARRSRDRATAGRNPSRTTAKARTTSRGAASRRILKSRHEGRPAAVDQVVGEHAGDDLAPQPVAADLGGIFLLHPVREISRAGRARNADRPARRWRRCRRTARSWHRRAARRVRPGSAARRAPSRSASAAGDGSVSTARSSSPRASSALMKRAWCGRSAMPARRGDRERQRLLVVVGQHQPAHFVRHLRKQLVARRSGQRALAHGRGQRDLDVDLDVGRVDAARIVDGVGIAGAAAQAELDARRAA